MFLLLNNNKKKVFVIEGIHSFGLSLLVFRVLPSCDVVRALLLMNCTCIVPGICKMVFSKNDAGYFGKFVVMLIDLVALAAQLSCFFVIMNTEYTAFIEKSLYAHASSSADQSIQTAAFERINQLKPIGITMDPFAEARRQQVTTDDDSGASSTVSDTDQQQLLKWKGSWEAPIALLFTSIIWWENYVDRDIKLLCFKLPFASYKRHLQAVRSKTNIGASLWKIGLTFAFGMLLLPNKSFDNAFVAPSTSAAIVPSSADSLANNSPYIQTPPPNAFDTEFSTLAPHMPDDLQSSENPAADEHNNNNNSNEEHVSALSDEEEHVADEAGGEEVKRRRRKRDIADDTESPPPPENGADLVDQDETLTVPNNIANNNGAEHTTETPNLFDFVADKVKLSFVIINFLVSV